MTSSTVRDVSIGDCVDSIQTWNPRMESSDEVFRYIDIASVSQDEKRIILRGEIPTAEAPSRARQLVQAGDILVSTVRPNLNAVACVPDDLDGATASTGFCVLRPNPKILDGRYLFHWVRAPIFVANMVKQATGQSYPAVSDKIIKSSHLPLPILEEQYRIAAILDQTDAIRSLRKRTMSRLSELGKSIFRAIIGDPIVNENAFDKVPLGDLIKVSSGEGLTAEKMRDGPFPVYGGNGINGWHDEARVEANTIVIGRVGVYCGTVHVTTEKAWVTDNALIVKKKRIISTPYLAAALMIANLNQYAGRSAQPLVSGSRIYPVEILLPPMEQQESFARAFNASEEEINRQGASANEMSMLFASLQHRAFRGEL
jgi:type I restriction enzyme, S subunit